MSSSSLAGGGAIANNPPEQELRLMRVSSLESENATENENYTMHLNLFSYDALKMQLKATLRDIYCWNFELRITRGEIIMKREVLARDDSSSAMALNYYFLGFISETLENRREREKCLHASFCSALLPSTRIFLTKKLKQ